MIGIRAFVESPLNSFPQYDFRFLTGPRSIASDSALLYDRRVPRDKQESTRGGFLFESLEGRMVALKDAVNYMLGASMRCSIRRPKSRGSSVTRYQAVAM